MECEVPRRLHSVRFEHNLHELELPTTRLLLRALYCTLFNDVEAVACFTLLENVIASIVVDDIQCTCYLGDLFVRHVFEERALGEKFTSHSHRG